MISKTKDPNRPFRVEVENHPAGRVTYCRTLEEAIVAWREQANEVFSWQRKKALARD